MKSLKKSFIGKDYFLMSQLIICIVFIIYFIKLDIKIVKTAEELKKQEVKNIKLLTILDSLQESLSYTNSKVDKSNLPKVDLSKNKSLDVSPIKILDTSDTHSNKYVYRDTIIKSDSVTSLVQIKSNTEFKYQADLRNNLIKLSEYENIMLLTARIQVSDLKSSTFSMQEINLEENGDNSSKLIYFNCIKSKMIDSTYDFVFTEKKVEKLEPLDPLNYNRDFAVSLKGTFTSKNIFCILYWKDITGRPFSARIRMLLKN